MSTRESENGAILDEDFAQQIKAAKERALALHGTPEGEKESREAAAWLEGWHAAGGMIGWLRTDEKQRMQSVIDAQDKIIAALTEQLAVKDRMVS